MNETITPPESARPLAIPAGRNLTENQIAQRLRGLVTAPNWLADGLWDELTEARDEHLRLRTRCAELIARLNALHRAFKAEDSNYTAQLKIAARTSQAEPEDTRTPPAERAQVISGVLDHLWAALEVLADHVDATIRLVQEKEQDWIGSLGGQLLEAEAERRAAQEQLARARAIEWRVHRLAGWVLATADDGVFGHGQPAPVLTPPPPNFEEVVLARPWWKQQDVDLNRASAA